MNITQIDGSIIPPTASKATSVELQKEYDYIAAAIVTGRLLETGLITADEYNALMQRSILTYSLFM